MPTQPTASDNFTIKLPSAGEKLAATKAPTPTRRSAPVETAKVKPGKPLYPRAQRILNYMSIQRDLSAKVRESRQSRDVEVFTTAPQRSIFSIIRIFRRKFYLTVNLVKFRSKSDLTVTF